MLREQKGGNVEELDQLDNEDTVWADLELSFIFWCMLRPSEDE